MNDCDVDCASDCLSMKSIFPTEMTELCVHSKCNCHFNEEGVTYVKSTLGED